MRPFQSLLDSVGQALCEKGRRALTGDIPFGDVLTEVSKSSLEHLRRQISGDDIRHALGETAGVAPNVYAAQLDKTLDALAKVNSLPNRDALRDYLLHFPLSIQQMFRRPSDPEGKTAPDKLEIYKPEQLLLYLPPRRARFRAGDEPAGLDNWQLVELRGLGECSEVWLGRDKVNAEVQPACLKFAIDEESSKRMVANQSLFVRVFQLNEISGIVPLQSVYLETQPPCLESTYVYGYDLAGLMNEWKWRYDAPKPEAALKLMRRLTDIVGKAHAKGILHRDLKPSNVLMHPAENGKFSVWITDFGWGMIEAERSIELSRGGTCRAEQARLSHRGAYTPLYASPQQQKRESPDPRDDVHALGVIWYQLLKRDPHAAAPVGDDWSEELQRHGFSASSAKLLSSCVATRSDKRPANAVVLHELLLKESVAVAATYPISVIDDGSRILSVKGQSTPQLSVTARGKQVDHAAAAVAAASLLGNTGGALGGRFSAKATGLSSTSGSSILPSISQERAADGLPKLIRNSLGITFTHIPAGSFDMGANEDEIGRKPHETPRHTVRLRRAIYISIFPVTQGQYEKLVGRNPAFFHKGNGGAGDLPVESVSWYDAERFCTKLSKSSDEQLAERIYRLPTEAEWEYACRAGVNATFTFGEKLCEKDAHFKHSVAQTKTHAVGRFPANAFGLHDVHGNVFEWVSDWYHDYYYFDTAGTDPTGPVGGDLKVIRGGSWVDASVDCRSAARKAQHPDRPTNTIGFRVVLTTNA